MIILALLILLAPGLIAVRILWRDKELTRQKYKLVICDYIIYSFLILIVSYGFIWIAYPERTVSFSAGIWAESHILSASFVLKYSVVALVAALILPACVSWLIKVWRKLEDGRKKRLAAKKEKK